MMDDVRKPNLKNFIQGKQGDWEVIIGMEVHAQLSSKAKLFSSSSTFFGAEPNMNVSFFDAGMPGTLPVLNQWCVHQAVKTSLGLKATIHQKSIFDRKNYFYPDLPQGYQITQFYHPIAENGSLIISVGPDQEGQFETIHIRIERLHMEQDAGKLLHDQHSEMSCVDLNRSGVALMEIVSKPDLRSPEEAKAYLTKLRAVLRYLGTCDGNMEEGSLRADVNVSVRKPGEVFGTRCEIKNVNSIRFVGQAIEYEALRQIELLEKGQEVHQETRLFDPVKGETRSMRSKEQANDYRYFPDPDLLPLEIDQSYIDAILTSLPELPDDKKERFISTMGLSSYDASILVSDKDLAEYFEKVAQFCDVKIAANWVINELMRNIKKHGQTIEDSNVSAEKLGVILEMMDQNIISGKIAKELFDIVWEEGGDPREIVELRSMRQITDVESIAQVVDAIITENPDKVAEIVVKPSLLGWFVGNVIKRTGGKANPKVVDSLIRSKLGIDHEQR